MKKYDWKKAKKLIADEIKNNPAFIEASMGMYEDWFWTANTVWKEGKFQLKLVDGLKIGGIDESDWATPTLQLCYADREPRMVPCFLGKSSNPSGKNRVAGGLGVLSGPCQDRLPLLED